MAVRPHDALFKATFGVPAYAIALFRAVVPPAVFDALEWADLRVENASFVDPALADRHGDLLFSLPRRDGSGHVLLYVLVEHQSQPDPHMPLRLLGYLVQIWQRARREAPDVPLPLIVPLVISHAPAGWTTASSLDELFPPELAAVEMELAEYLPRFRILIEDLARATDDRIRARVAGPVPQLVCRLLRDARDHASLIASVDAWPDVYEAAGQRDPAALHQILAYVDQIVEPFLVEEFRAKLALRTPTAGAIAMRWSELQREEARREGREEGREEGQRELLRRQLTLKFGALSPEHEARLAAASAADLDRFAERVLIADSAAAVLAS